MRLQDKVAIITGAGQGIGKAYAQRFLDEGAKVVIADYNDERGETALADLKDRGEVIYVNTDVSAEESADECVRRTVEEFGGVDVLINNAALYYDMDMEDQSVDYLKRVFDVNLHGAYIMSKAVAPSMVERGGGSIINQSSTAAYLYVMPSGEDDEFRGVPANPYGQTKWGIIGLTKFLAGQLGKHNIRVNCITPGVTMTEATKKMVPDEMAGMITMMTALGRTLEPEDLTGSAVFFASEDSALVTGQALCVDAGMEMPA